MEKKAKDAAIVEAARDTIALALPAQLKNYLQRDDDRSQFILYQAYEDKLQCVATVVREFLDIHGDTIRDNTEPEICEWIETHDLMGAWCSKWCNDYDDMSEAQFEYNLKKIAESEEMEKVVNWVIYTEITKAIDAQKKETDE